MKLLVIPKSRNDRNKQMNNSKIKIYTRGRDFDAHY